MINYFLILLFLKNINFAKTLYYYKYNLYHIIFINIIINNSIDTYILKKF